MSLQNPYSIFLFISACIAFITAVITWPRRTAPGAFPLFLMLITTILWAGANGMLLESDNAEQRLFWFDVMLFGSLLGSPAFLAFGLQFTNRGHWLSKRNIFLICFIPVLSLILAWTNSQHHLFYKVLDFSTRLPNESWNIVSGSFFWLYLIYSYGIVFFTIGIVVLAFYRASPVYRGQAAAILIGTLIPLIGNLIYNLVIGVGQSEVDPTPLLFTVIGCVYAYGLFWYRLFDVVPVARHALVENMQDGVIVVDHQNRIVDVNPSALRWLKWNQSTPVGRNIQDLLNIWFEQISDFPQHLYVETEVHSVDLTNYFDLRVEPLLDQKKNLTGRLIVFRDITRQKQIESALRDVHDRLRIQLKEIELLQEELREQAIRDPLTGLFNRRYLQETLERELSRAVREGSSVGLCMADIDLFKSFNDRYGHKAGDMILQALSEIFRSHSRIEDVVCRYGGEEFVILLPGANLQTVMKRAEEWRKSFEELRIEFEGKVLSTTLSIGVAVFPQHARTTEELFIQVDEALYQSKHDGRNQISLAKVRSH